MLQDVLETSLRLSSVSNWGTKGGERILNRDPRAFICLQMPSSLQSVGLDHLEAKPRFKMPTAPRCSLSFFRSQIPMQ